MNGTTGEGGEDRGETRGEEKGGLWLNYSPHHGQQRKTFSSTAQAWAPALLLTNTQRAATWEQGGTEQQRRCQGHILLTCIHSHRRKEAASEQQVNPHKDYTGDLSAQQSSSQDKHNNKIMILKCLRCEDLINIIRIRCRLYLGDVLFTPILLSAY